MPTLPHARGIRDIAAAEPDRPALAFRSSITTVGEVEAAIRAAAARHADAGVTTAARAAFMLHNSPDDFAIWNAVARLGALVVPIGYRSAPPEIAYQLTDSAARFFVHDDAERAGVALRLGVGSV